MLETHVALEGEGVAGGRVAVAVAPPALSLEELLFYSCVAVAASLAGEALVAGRAEALLDRGRLHQVGRLLGAKLKRGGVQAGEGRRLKLLLSFTSGTF